MARVYPIPSVYIPELKQRTLEFYSTAVSISAVSGAREASTVIDLAWNPEIKGICITSIRSYAVSGDVDAEYSVILEDSNGVFYQFDNINRTLVDSNLEIVIPPGTVTVRIKIARSLTSDTTYNVVIGYKTVHK